MKTRIDAITVLVTTGGYEYSATVITDKNGYQIKFEKNYEEGQNYLLADKEMTTLHTAVMDALRACEQGAFKYYGPAH